MDPLYYYTLEIPTPTQSRAVVEGGERWSVYRGMAEWYLVWLSGLQEGVRCVGATHVRIGGRGGNGEFDPCDA